MRVISLVPSLTETLFALGLSATEIVGRTPWCINPESAVDSIPIVGGTKTPKLSRIVSIAPDVVLMEREENRREAHDELVAAGLRVWVAHVTRVADVPPMLESLGAAVGRAARGRELAGATQQAIDETVRVANALQDRPVALPLIWHDPLMSVAPSRYSGDILTAAGFTVPDLSHAGGPTGYPSIAPRDIGEARTAWLLLSSEPHDFTIEEGESIADSVEATGYARPRVCKVDGEALTWFGSRTASALAYWRDLRLTLD